MQRGWRDGRAGERTIPICTTTASVPEPPPAIDWRAKYYELLATFQSRARVKIDPMAGLRTERPRAADIIRIVAAHHHLSVNDIVGHYRAQKFVLARTGRGPSHQKANVLLSLPQIGKAFNGRDHTTIIHALKKIAQKVGTRFGRARRDRVPRRRSS